jgi:hypothetical protein
MFIYLFMGACCSLVGGGAFAPFDWSAGARWEAAAFVTCFEMPTAGTKVEGSATALDRVAGSLSNLEGVTVAFFCA